jgi:hypothetical protein
MTGFPGKAQTMVLLMYLEEKYPVVPARKTKGDRFSLCKEATIYEIIINLVKNSDERYGNAI